MFDHVLNEIPSGWLSGFTQMEKVQTHALCMDHSLELARLHHGFVAADEPEVPSGRIRDDLCVGCAPTEGLDVDDVPHRCPQFAEGTSQCLRQIFVEEEVHAAIVRSNWTAALTSAGPRSNSHAISSMESSPW